MTSVGGDRPKGNSQRLVREREDDREGEEEEVEDDGEGEEDDEEEDEEGEGKEEESVKVEVRKYWGRKKWWGGRENGRRGKEEEC